MSEYTCEQGHIIKTGEHKCRICGGRIRYEDGKSEKEIKAEDREEDE